MKCNKGISSVAVVFFNMLHVLQCCVQSPVLSHDSQLHVRPTTPHKFTYMTIIIICVIVVNDGDIDLLPNLS